MRFHVFQVFSDVCNALLLHGLHMSTRFKCETGVCFACLENACLCNVSELSDCSNVFKIVFALQIDSFRESSFSRDAVFRNAFDELHRDPFSRIPNQMQTNTTQITRTVGGR